MSKHSEMSRYIGTKIIMAAPMCRAEAEAHLGRDVGGNKHGEGYLVEYEGGYQSWSPKDVFDEAYRQTVGMTFGLAIEALKMGMRVARSDWNGKGMWLSLSCDGTREVQAENFWSPHNAQFARENGGKATVLPAITMKTATGEILMGWLASQTDMLAEDWMVVQ